MNISNLHHTWILTYDYSNITLTAQSYSVDRVLKSEVTQEQQINKDVFTVFKRYIILNRTNFWQVTLQ